MKRTAVMAIALWHLVSSNQVSNQRVFTHDSVHDGGVQIHFSGTLHDPLPFNPTVTLHWKDQVLPSGSKDFRITNNLIDVTSLVCNPTITSGSVQIWLDSDYSETFDISSYLFVGSPNFSADYQNGFVTVSSNRFKQYCLNNGSVKVNSDTERKSITLSQDSFYTQVDGCQGQATKTLEIFSGHQKSLGFCQFSVPDPATQDIGFYSGNQNIIFKQWLACVDKVVAYDKNGQGKDMNCTTNRNNKLECQLSQETCKTETFDIYVVFKLSQKFNKAGTFQNYVNLVTRDSSFAKQYSHAIKLGRFDMTKLKCFAETISILYLDTGVTDEASYEVDSYYKTFKAKLKIIEKKCENAKVKASVQDIFGNIVYEKVIELYNTKLEGSISFTEFKKDSRTFLTFSTTTVGFLDCYIEIRVGNSLAIDFKNQIDVTNVFNESCHEVRNNIYLLSPGRQRTIPYVRNPSLQPPPYETIFKATPDIVAKTIQLETSPAAPLTCLKVTMNGDTIPLDISGRLNISKYFSPCHDQTIQLSVNRDAERNKKKMLSTNFTLPKMTTLGKINLDYDEPSKIVRVEADEGTLACAGNGLIVTSMDDLERALDQHPCTFGLFISGSTFSTTVKGSPSDCRQLCLADTQCTNWRFGGSQNYCDLFSSVTNRMTGYTNYVSGPRLCMLPGDNVVKSTSKQFSIEQYLLPCKESLLNVEFEGLNKNDVYNLTINHSPHLNTTFNGTHIIIKIENYDFEDCPNLQYELQTRAPDSDTFISVLNFSTSAIEAEKYMGMNFRVRSWIEEKSLHWARFENFSLPANENDAGSSKTVSGVISVFLLMLIAIAIIYLVWTKTIQVPAFLLKSDLDIIPSNIKYNKFKKNSSLQDNLDRVMEKETKSLREEFKNIETIVQEKVNPKVSFNIAKANSGRNRYKDMVPYDNNIAKLKAPTGRPASNYVSASWIKFNKFSQRFIASQAPKPNTFSIFWQLLLEQKVSVIVMITDLVEGKKLKAHQYWPDVDNPTLNLEGGMKIDYLSHSFPGTYYHRKMRITNQDGMTHDVIQLHCTAWRDMSAPNDTKILLDLAYAVLSLDLKLNPLLVHCSAGVGRTGTFIGFYKLIHDIMNQKVKEFSVFETVLKMRSQRKQMVQKDVQYIYLHKCLLDFVAAMESAYE